MHINSKNTFLMFQKLIYPTITSSKKKKINIIQNPFQKILSIFQRLLKHLQHIRQLNILILLNYFTFSIFHTVSRNTSS